LQGINPPGAAVLVVPFLKKNSFFEPRSPRFRPALFTYLAYQASWCACEESNAHHRSGTPMPTNMT